MIRHSFYHHCHHFFIYFSMLVFLLSSTVVAAQQTSPESGKDAISVIKDLEKLETDYKNIDSIKGFEGVDKQLISIENFAETCLVQLERSKKSLDESLTELGEIDRSEDVSVKRKRDEILKNQKNLINQLSQCRLISVRAQTLKSDVEQSIKDRLRQKLSARQPGLEQHLTYFLSSEYRFYEDIRQIKQHLTQVFLFDHGVLLSLFVAVVSGALGWLWWIYHRRSSQAIDYQRISSITLYGFMQGLIKTSIIILPAITIFIALGFFSVGSLLFQEIALLFVVLGIAYSAMRIPLYYQIEGSVIADNGSKRYLRRWVNVLIAVCVLGLLVKVNLSTDDNLNTVWFVIRTIVTFFIGFAMFRLIWLLSKYLPILRVLKLHVLSMLILFIGFLAMLIGYQNLASFIYEAFFISIMALLMFWLLIRISDELFDGLDSGKSAWQQSLRKQFGIQDQQPFFGLVWFRLSLALALFALLVIVLLSVWQVSNQAYTQLIRYVVQGFQIGEWSLKPLSFIWAILTVILLIHSIRGVKSFLFKRWLQHTKLSRGASDALMTLIGYAGVLVAVIIGLSMIGVNFANLAIIAGALSVGIGFGLQTIVNNFVSGLILLFERPIRRGDWIKIGDSQGIVKDISIRSTTIRTFEHSDIIVPNSDLIANQVKNMMLSDEAGRVTIPVGVAYGSDTRLVLKLLSDIANANPLVISDNPDMSVMSVMRGFGDSSLNFELRCYIYKVTDMLVVTSELSLAIDDAFREHGIEIPFPQHDLHVRSGLHTPNN